MEDVINSVYGTSNIIECQVSRNERTSTEARKTKTYSLRE